MTTIETLRTSPQEYIYELLVDASIEALPSQLINDSAIIDQIPSANVFIPHLPGSNLDNTIAATKSVAGLGRKAVPHLPARSFKNKEELSSWLSQIRETDTTRLLVIAGDSNSSKGPFSNTASILETGLLEFYDFKTIFVSGHPDGHPVAKEAELLDALAAKCAWSNSTGMDLRIVTQFTFNIEGFSNWMLGIKDVIQDVPVHLGIAGPASTALLMKYALSCGVKLSGRFMLTNAKASKLLVGWAPDELLADLSNYNHISAPAGIHIFPFGGIKKTADWISKNTSIQRVIV